MTLSLLKCSGLLLPYSGGRLPQSGISGRTRVLRTAELMTPEQTAALKAKAVETAGRTAVTLLKASERAVELGRIAAPHVVRYAGQAGAKATEATDKARAVFGKTAADLGAAMVDPQKRQSAIRTGGAALAILVLIAIAIPLWKFADSHFERRAAEQRIEDARRAQEAQRPARQQEESRQRQEQLPPGPPLPVQQTAPAPQPAPAPIPSALPQPIASVTGPATLLDTATLEIAGRRVSLAGLVPVPHPGALGAARAYLQNNGSNVNCRAIGPNTEAMECTLIGRGTDIGEVFVLSGFATVTSNAPTKIRQAEAQARQSRTGVWGQ